MAEPDIEMAESPDLYSPSEDSASEPAPVRVGNGGSPPPTQHHLNDSAPDSYDDADSASDISMDVESDDGSGLSTEGPMEATNGHNMSTSGPASSKLNRKRRLDENGQRKPIWQDRKRHKSKVHEPEVSNVKVNKAKANEAITGNAMTNSAAASKTNIIKAASPGSTSPRHIASKGPFLLPEIWCHIFTFAEPRTLGRLLQVNKLFNSLLNPLSSKEPQPLMSRSTSAVKPLNPDAIWKASRRRFCGNMPAPLQGRSELDMWRLLLSRRCQLCPNTGPGSPPDPDGSMIVWSFGIRCCASCLGEGSMKVRAHRDVCYAVSILTFRSQEIDLLLSSSLPSVLSQALPFALVTDELRPLSSIAVQNGQVAPDVQVTKLFLRDDIQRITHEFFEAKKLGVAAAAEWSKGLDDRGRNVRNDSARWERWESLGGLARIPSSTSNLPTSHTSPTPDPSQSKRVPRPATNSGQSTPGKDLAKILHTVVVANCLI